MKIISNREMQRSNFVDQLYKNLRKKTAKAIAEFDKFASLAKEYAKDGLNDDECIELLMIDGLTREASEGYVEMIKNANSQDDLNTYSFQYEDNHGKITSSQEIGKIVRASSDSDAWQLIEQLADEENIDFDKVVSIEKL